MKNSNMKSILEPEKKLYSAREAMNYIPQIASEPTLRKFIENDLCTNNFLNAIVQVVGKQKRYFIPARVLKKLVESY